MVGHGGSSAGSYLADPTSSIPSHCGVIILFKSVAVHQLSWLALKELKCKSQGTGVFVSAFDSYKWYDVLDEGAGSWNISAQIKIPVSK